jgi:AcrR family transcriptional regulator
MRIVRKGGKETGRKLLEAAAEVFAEKGYRGATVAEICRLASANIAAINYHFRDKETLYAEAWRYAFSGAIKKHPPDGGVPADAPAGERLRGHIEALLRRISDEKNIEFRIARKELANPTGLLKEVMKEEVAPLHERMEKIIRDLLSPNVPDSQVRHCVISIVSQCFEPVALSLAIKEEGGEHPPPLDIAEYIEHVVRFSLGGIKSLAASSSAPDARRAQSPGKKKIRKAGKK